MSAALPAGAQMGMMTNFSSGSNWEEVYNHTIQGEAAGKEVWQKLQSGQVKCADLSEEDFDVLGEYFMGQMMGDSHAYMNGMMMQAHGEDGEEQIHITMGKRFSGCDTSATLSSEWGGWMPMMQMSPWGFRGQQKGGTGMPWGMNYNMMNYGFGSGPGFLGLIIMVFWWLLVIAGVIFFIKWLVRQAGGSSTGSALETLKQRYAKGEINKQEFEEKKKDLM